MPKMALRIILPILEYKAALAKMNLETLENRRNHLTLKFAKQAKEHNNLSHLFQENIKTHQMKTQNMKTYSENAHTERYKRSSIMNMKKILNSLKHN